MSYDSEDAFKAQFTRLLTDHTFTYRISNVDQRKTYSVSIGVFSEGIKRQVEMVLTRLLDMGVIAEKDLGNPSQEGKICLPPIKDKGGGWEIMILGRSARRLIQEGYISKEVIKFTHLAEEGPFGLMVAKSDRSEAFLGELEKFRQSWIGRH